MQRFRGRKGMDRDRRGAILVLTAVVMVLMFSIAALGIDLSYLTLLKNQLQTAADAAALAGALELSGVAEPSVVRANALAAIQDVASKHKNGDKSSVTVDAADVTFGKSSWNTATQSYTTQWGNSYVPYNVVKVRAERTAGVNGAPDDRVPLLFASIFGQSKATIGAEASASFQPRDIMVVLDYSGSMNDDSTFARISSMGRTYIESNSLTMWHELGSPIYGKLTFTPSYAVLSGVAASGTIPHIDTTYKRTSIAVISTSNLTQVKLQFSNSATQTFTGLSAQTGTFAGTGSNAGKEITYAWIKSGGNQALSSGNLGEQFTFSATTIKTALGLNIAYPYPSGSWSDYISKVQASSGNIKNAGYRDMFGYMTWIEYLQTYQPSSAQTPDLWKTSEQPVGVLKDGVDEFINYIQSIEADDYVGLSIYTHTNSTGAILEHPMSTNLDQIKTTARHRQAGHYLAGTNISAGMLVARQEIVARARPRAFRLMIVMTDGEANLPNNTTTAKAAVLTEANAAAAAQIKIVTISLGSGADISLMQQVADITGGIHFNVPGGVNIATVQANLQEVFRQVASSRPLRLINSD